jgi:hypothetical protein
VEVKLAKAFVVSISERSENSKSLLNTLFVHVAPYRQRTDNHVANVSQHPPIAGLHCPFHIVAAALVLLLQLPTEKFLSSSTLSTKETQFFSQPLRYT